MYYNKGEKTIQYNYNITSLQTKVYQYSRSFNKFRNIDECSFNKVKNNLENFQSFFGNDKGLKKYIATLEILAKSTNMHFYTYDERMVFLILATDPELITYKYYIFNSLHSNQQSLLTENEINAQKKEEDLLYQKSVRDKIGFFDRQLLKYEIDYFQRIKNIILLDNIIKDYSPILLNLVNTEDFQLNSITKERLLELEQLADSWNQEKLNGSRLLNSSFNILHQPKLLKLENNEEQLIFFILINDPQLNCLKIYEEESKIDNIKQRCLEESGFYNYNLIKLEQIYRDTFYPNVTLSGFTFLSKK